MKVQPASLLIAIGALLLAAAAPAVAWHLQPARSLDVAMSRGWYAPIVSRLLASRVR